MMGNSSHISNSSKKLELRVCTDEKRQKSCLVGPRARAFSQKTLKCITSVKQGVKASGAASDIGVFLLTTASLEIVRRFSLANCPFIWRALQALQLLCYPPFKWIQRWAPFTSLVKNMQTLSRPMLVLSIATIFSDQLPTTKGTFNGSDDAQASQASPSEPSSQSSTPKRRSPGKGTQSVVSENCLMELYKELDKQGIDIPERVDEDELRRFYAVSHGDFSRFLSSVKKTIHWRQTYTLLSPEELQAWVHLVFWHGFDLEQRPCLMIRLGFSVSKLTSNDRSLFARAVVSQIEYGVLNLIDVEHPQLTVLMDCDGLSPFGFPVQMLRSCAVLLQDHYPNRLGCLLVVRLPAIARVITRTLFQVLKPRTRQKLRIVGDNYQEVLSSYFEVLPSFLGGNCSCSKCSNGGLPRTNEQTIRTRPSFDLTIGSNVSLPDTDQHADDLNVSLPDVNRHAGDLNISSPDINQNADIIGEMSREEVRLVVMGVIMMWIFITFMLGVYDAQLLSQLYNKNDS